MNIDSIRTFLKENNIYYYSPYESVLTANIKYNNPYPQMLYIFDPTDKLETLPKTEKKIVLWKRFPHTEGELFAMIMEFDPKEKVTIIDKSFKPEPHITIKHALYVIQKGIERDIMEAEKELVESKHAKN